MSKKNFILGGILIILIILAYLYQGPFKEWRANSGKVDNFLAEIEVDNVEKIEIISNQQTVELNKQGERWKVGGTKDFYVKDDLANNIKNSLADVIKAEIELVSANKEKRGEFMANDPSAGSNQGVRVKLYQGENMTADFIIGKAGNDFVSAYISEPDSNNTYSLKTNISSLFNRVEWRDDTIFSSNKDNIQKIRFQYPNREFIVEKTADEVAYGVDDAEEVELSWKGTAPYKFSVDQEKISKIVDIMSILNAAKIPEQTFNGTGLEKNLIIIQATGDGIDNTLMIGDNNGEDLYFVKKGDSDNVYLITKDQEYELNKRIGDLK